MLTEHSEELGLTSTTFNSKHETYTPGTLWSTRNTHRVKPQ